MCLLMQSPSPYRLNASCTCPPALVGSIGCVSQWILGLEVYTRCFVDDLWFEWARFSVQKTQIHLTTSLTQTTYPDRFAPSTLLALMNRPVVVRIY
jgi:hypothetical protein